MPHSMVRGFELNMLKQITICAKYLDTADLAKKGRGYPGFRFGGPEFGYPKT